MSPDWNDRQWIPCPPNTHAEHFLLNLSVEIPEKEQRKTTRRLIKSLYHPIDGLDGTALVSKDPWTELTRYATTKRNSPKLIEIIEQLRKTLGSLTIEWPQSEIYSSAHYDFHLTTKKSNKRKLSDS